MLVSIASVLGELSWSGKKRPRNHLHAVKTLQHQRPKEVGSLLVGPVGVIEFCRVAVSRGPSGTRRDRFQERLKECGYGGDGSLDGVVDSVVSRISI